MSGVKEYARGAALVVVLAAAYGAGQLYGSGGNVTERAVGVSAAGMEGADGGAATDGMGAEPNMVVVQQQPPPALSAIREDELRRDLMYLAGDHFRGRESGTLDEMRASMWLAEQARLAGMEPAGDDGTYFQFFPVGRVAQSEGSRVALGNRVLAFNRDFILRARLEYFAEAPFVSLGAREPGSFDDVDVRGKVVGIAMTQSGFESVPMGAGTIRVLGTTQRAQRAINLYADSLRARGAVAVIMAVVPDVEREFVAIASPLERGQYPRDTSVNINSMPGVATGTPGGQGGATIPVILLRGEASGAIAADAQTARVALYQDRYMYPSVNVVARIPGSDPSVRGEYVLYSAHQDHDGVRYPMDGDDIWNGADDNATTSVALLAIGRAIKAAPTRRSSLFVWHGAEERGLIGSYWHAANPVVPRDSIVAVLNGDMIGRNHPDSAALLGAQPPHRNSTLLANLALQANDLVTKFIIDTTWDRPTHREGWYFRSDHLPYARANVPALFFSSLLHDDYHTPRDDPERIDISKLRRMTQWMYTTGWLVGNSPQRPTIDPGFRLER